MNDQMNQGNTSPTWWKETHTSGWDKVKSAFKRDWEQTKADLSSTHGKELDQNAADTVKQAVGSNPIPPTNVPNPPDKKDFEKVEPAARFGYGARSEYATFDEWDDGLETKLRNDWSTIDANTNFDDVKPHIRSGWDFANAKPTDKTTQH